MILSQKNPHPFDARIKFQKDGHKYWIDNNSENIISSTTFIKKFFKEFDSDSVIKNIVNSFDYKENPEYKYYQMKPDDIKNSWELNGQKARDLGTLLHEDIENYYNEVKVINCKFVTDEFKYFLNFVSENDHIKADLEEANSKIKLLSENLASCKYSSEEHETKYGKLLLKIEAIASAMKNNNNDRAQQLLTENGKELLRREILNKINEVSDKPVQNIFFTEFLVE